MKKIFLIAIIPLLSIVIINSCKKTNSDDIPFRRHLKNLVEIPQDTMTIDFLSFKSLDSNRYFYYDNLEYCQDCRWSKVHIIGFNKLKLYKIRPYNINDIYRSKNENDMDDLSYYIIYDSLNKKIIFDNELLFAEDSYNDLNFKFQNKFFIVSNVDPGPHNDDDSPDYYDALVSLEQIYPYKHKLKKFYNCERIAIVMPSNSNLRVIVQILKRTSTRFYAPALKGIHPISEYDLVPVKFKEYIIDKDLNIISSRFIEFEQI